MGGKRRVVSTQSRNVGKASADAQLRRLIGELGLARSRELIAEVERRLGTAPTIDWRALNVSQWCNPPFEKDREFAFSEDQATGESERARGGR